MVRPRLTPAVLWRVSVREAEVANSLGTLPMTREAPFGLHDDPERFAGSVVRVRRAGGPPLTGIVARTPKKGCAVWVTLLCAGDKLRDRRFLGSEVLVVLREVDRGPVAPPPEPKTEKRAGTSRLGLKKLRELFAQAKKVVEYRQERGGETRAAMADGPLVLEQWLARQRKGLMPRGPLKYLGAARYRLKYDRTWWVDFESDPP